VKHTSKACIRLLLIFSISLDLVSAPSPSHAQCPASETANVDRLSESGETGESSETDSTEKVFKTDKAERMGQNEGIGEMVGEVTPVRKVSLAFKVSGRIQKVDLFAGDIASEGMPVAWLDPRDFELSVAQAEASLQIGRLRLKQMETGSRPEEKNAAAENLGQARANRDNAQSELVRACELCIARAVSKQALDDAEAKAKVCEAQFMTAQQQKTMIDKGPRTEETDQARVMARQLDASLALAKLQLEYATIKSPFNAVVAARLLDEGAFANNTSPVYNLVQIDPVFVSVECPERILPRLRPGMTGIISVDALPGKTFSGSVKRVPGVVDPKTRSARLELEVSNPDFELKPGMFARVRLSSAP